MGAIVRKPLQGVFNILRFNWPYFLVASFLFLALVSTRAFWPPSFMYLIDILLATACVSTLLSLYISWYVYDYSDLYTLNWLNSLQLQPSSTLLNIHAGFDETSILLKKRYPDSTLEVFDFYDRQQHTERSIERARKAYAPFPDTKHICTKNLSLQPGSAHCIFFLLAAHEIRADDERIVFFKQLSNALKEGGKIVLVEHLRDGPNFAAYTIGFFHFLSRSTWQKTFAKANLSITSEFKITPFLTCFILTTHGNPS